MFYKPTCINKLKETPIENMINLVRMNAIHFTGNFEEIEKFCGGDSEFREDQLVVATSKGPLYVKPNQWIIKTVDNTFYTLEGDQWLITGVDLGSGGDFTGHTEVTIMPGKDPIYNVLKVERS